MYRVVLAEEQPAMRHAVRSLLDRERYAVVGEVADGLEALSQTLEVKPDLLILALRLKRLGGLEVIRRLRRRRAKVKILVLTAADSEHFIGLCMQAGASGFVSKQDDLADLLLALEAIAQGRTFFPGGAAAIDAGRRSEADQLASLSARELTVMNYLASGFSNGAIAREMALSDRTVSTYKVRLFRKLNITNLVELVEVARRARLLGPGMSEPQSDADVFAAGIDGEDGQERDQGALMRRALDAIPAGISIRDRRGRLLFANDHLLAAYQRKREDLLGSSIADSDLIDARDAAELDAIYKEAVKLGVSFDREVVVTYRGRVTTQRFWGGPMRDARGDVVSMVCGQWNLSEQEAAFAHLREGKAQADAARRASGALLVEHVRRAGAPLGALESALRRMQGAAPDDAALAEARGAAHALRMQHELLETWLDLRAESGAPGAAVSRSCELGRFAHELAGALRERLGEPAPLITTNVDDLRAPRVWMDEARCRVVLASALAPLGAAFRAEGIALRVRSALKSRALVAMDIDVVVTRSGDAPEDASNIDMARELCERIEARLAIVEQDASRLRLRVSMILPKAADR
ncbi:response regulator [Caballeronia hypogeia]|uniref:response regulator n=1 Tax=Caballeronia hypogeia TaxID=1777140 RepID=UPI000772C6E6|nr:response regulator [Caballeronia hypogeia]